MVIALPILNAHKACPIIVGGIALATLITHVALVRYGCWMCVFTLEPKFLIDLSLM